MLIVEKKIMQRFDKNKTTRGWKVRRRESNKRALWRLNKGKGQGIGIGLQGQQGFGAGGR